MKLTWIRTALPWHYNQICYARATDLTNILDGRHKVKVKHKTKAKGIPLKQSKFPITIYCNNCDVNAEKKKKWFARMAQYTRNNVWDRFRHCPISTSVRVAKASLKSKQ